MIRNYENQNQKGIKKMAKQKLLMAIAILGIVLICSGCVDQQSEDSAPGQLAEEFQSPEGVKSDKVEKNNHSQAVILQRVTEANENAFSLLVPKGWLTEGGIFRVDPTAQGGAAQSIAAKLDFSVKNDQSGSVMMRWLPDMLYVDVSASPAGEMGLFPPGSNYNGMTVYPLMSAEEYLTQVAFPYAHPEASGVQIVEQHKLYDLAQAYLQRVNTVMPQTTLSYDAAIMTVTYWEDETPYEERILTVIENWGDMGAGMWGNKETVLLRTPIGEYGTWEPIFSVIQSSVEISPQWILGEIQGQMQRGQTMLDVQKEVQQIGQAMVEHRQKTNAEIHNDIFLTLTDQEEYVNPFTNQIETGSNQWDYRWVNEAGEVIYTNDEYYDPRLDVDLNRVDFERTPIRKR